MAATEGAALKVPVQSLSAQRGLPVLAGAGRRWFFTNIIIATALAIGGGEAWWHLFVLPRRRRRDEYFQKLGVEWKSIF